jgi:diguanylate cyclase (GGDEF)-like protein
MKPLHYRHAGWRLILGPSLTLAVAGALLLLARAGIHVPAPGGFMLATVFLASYFGGVAAGYLSAALGAVCNALLLTEPELAYTPDPSLRVTVVAVLALIVPILTVFLRNRATRRLEWERTLRERAEAANRELLSLRAELVRHAQQLERLATTDDLTGLCNRRHFLALAADALRWHAREQRPLALLIFDIDLFKSINDRFGHDAGDAVIRQVAEVCRSGMHRSDILARIGGEEFVLLLPDTNGEQAAKLAEQLRLLLEATPFIVDGTDIAVTVSIGGADADVASECVGDVMKRADQALYQAKREGRNRVRFSRRKSQLGNALSVSPAAAA